MTHVKDTTAGPVLVICEEAPQVCELCGKEAETRPYGPGGKTVCFPCAMKDPETAQRQFAKRLGSK